MTPSQLPHHHISAIVICFADVDGMIAAFAVIFRVFFVGGGLGGGVLFGRGGRRGSVKM